MLDWNNNYGEDPDKAVCFHCSNLPKHFFADVVMDFQEIIAGTVGKENTFGTCVGRVKAGAMSYLRFSTDDYPGKIRGYVGEGEFTNDPLETFGGAGVVKIPQMQKLLRFICEQGLSIMWRRTSRRWRARCTKRRRGTWGGRCITTTAKKRAVKKQDSERHIRETANSGRL